MNSPTSRVAVLIFLLFLGRSMAQAYMMRTEFTLDELQKNADVVFKAKAVSNTPGLDPTSGATVTQFKIVSVLKGTISGDGVKFQHIDNPPQNQFVMGPPPINYHFEPGKTYLVFAKASQTAGVYEPLWNMPQSEGNQGVFTCADDKPAAATVHDEVWAQLTGLLKSSNSTDLLYAIGQLDQMSAGERKPRVSANFEATDDFDRKAAIDAVHGFIASKDSKVAQAALFTVGSHNPYMTQERAWFWLATIGSGVIEGLSLMDPKMNNPGGELYWNDLLAVADKGPDDATRALALRALGLARRPEIGPRLLKYLTDPASAVRAAAIVVLADYPDLSTSAQMSRMGVDPDPVVRVAVAQCIGFGQIKESVELLSRMLTDPVLEVRKAAAQSLLSFSARDPAVAAIFKAHLHGPEFAPVFLNALAHVDPAPYLNDLAAAVQSYSPGSMTGDWWWGGEVPESESREILFKFLKTQSADKLKSGTFDHDLDLMEKGALGNMGMGNSFEVYAFEIRHGLTARAEALRAAALKAFPFQQPISYDQARDHPEIYDQ